MAVQSLHEDSGGFKLEESLNANFIRVEKTAGDAEDQTAEDQESKDPKASQKSQALPDSLPIIGVSATGSELEPWCESLERAENSDSPHREFHTAVIHALNIKPVRLQNPSGICQEASSLLDDHTTKNLVQGKSVGGLIKSSHQIYFRTALKKTVFLDLNEMGTCVRS